MTANSTARLSKRRSQIPQAIARLALFAALSLFGAAAHLVDAQASATLTVKVSKTQVAPGETFSVDIVQNASVASLGAEGTFYFNAGLLQITSVDVGPDYTDAQFIFGVAPLAGDSAIAAANGNGELDDLTTFFLEGSGNVAPGDHVVATITLKAMAAGTSDLKFDQRQQIVTDPISGTQSTIPGQYGILPDPPDALGTLITATPQPSQVTIVAGTTPPPGASATASSGSATPAHTPRASGGPSITPDSALSSEIKMTVTPQSVHVTSGGTATATIAVDSPIAITGAQVSLSFDKTKVAVSQIQAGDQWKATNSSGYDSKISPANQIGELNGLVITQKPGANPIPAGKVTLFTITFKPANGDASSDLTLSSGSVVDTNGNDIQLTTLADAATGANSGGGGGLGSIILIFGGLLGLGVVGGGGFLTLRNRKGNRWGE